MEKLNIFFSVIGKPETYLSIVYLILAFPLGIIIGFLSLHVFYFMGEILGKFAEVMLSSDE